MTQYKITYMVDPGDGIESTTNVTSSSDHMGEVLKAWMDGDDGEGGINEYFVTKCEIIGEDDDE